MREIAESERSRLVVALLESSEGESFTGAGGRSWRAPSDHIDLT